MDLCMEASQNFSTGRVYIGVLPKPREVAMCLQNKPSYNSCNILWGINPLQRLSIKRELELTKKECTGF